MRRVLGVMNRVWEIWLWSKMLVVVCHLLMLPCKLTSLGYYYSYENADTISLATRSEVLPDQVSGLTSYRPPSIGSSLLPPSSDYPPEPILAPDCSACGTRLVYMRYVCLDCGEADMWKENEPSKTQYGMSETGHSDGSGETAMVPVRNGSGSRPRSESTSTHTSRGPGLGDNGKGRQVRSEGYELCPGCIEVHGLEHARSSALSLPGQSARVSETRHTFREKIWGSQGWQDVGESPLITITCLADMIQNTMKIPNAPYVTPQSWMIASNASPVPSSISANPV